jgi:hypothetical protein
MARYVVDASVILKWVSGDEHESDQDKARGLLDAWVEDRSEILAPSLLEYEVGNFLDRRLYGQASKKMALLLNLRFTSIALTEKMHELCFYWMAYNMGSPFMMPATLLSPKKPKVFWSQPT